MHVRTGCGGLTGTVVFGLLVSMLLLGSGHLGLLLLIIPLVLLFAAFSFLRMLGRSMLMLSRISDAAWQEAQRHAQERLAEQLRYFEAQQRGPGGAFGDPRSQQRPPPPGPSHNTADWARSVLGVRPGATPVEIRHAFREASKRWHPDLFMQASADERADAERHMEDVTAAHAILTEDSRGRVA